MQFSGTTAKDSSSSKYAYYGESFGTEVFTHNHCCMCDANSWVSDKVVYTQETQKLHEFGQKGGRYPIQEQHLDTYNTKLMNQNYFLFWALTHSGLDPPA